VFRENRRSASSQIVASVRVKSILGVGPKVKKSIKKTPSGGRSGWKAFVLGYTLELKVWLLHRPGYMISFQAYLLHFCFILSLYFYNNVFLFIGIWLEYHSLFQDMCFCNQFLRYDMPQICLFRYSYPLTVSSVLYTHWGQCVIQVWGYGRTKHCPIFCYVIL